MNALGRPHKLQRLLCRVENFAGRFDLAIILVLATVYSYVFPNWLFLVTLVYALTASRAWSRVNGMPINSSNRSASKSVLALVMIFT